MTTDRNYLGKENVDLFDALVIHIRFFLHKKETLEMIPEKRKSFQRYVFYTHEAPRRFRFPFYNHELLERYNIHVIYKTIHINFLSINVCLFLSNFFNWTMNYRIDSDILDSYGFKLWKKGSKPRKSEYTSLKSPNGFNINWYVYKHIQTRCVLCRGTIDSQNFPTEFLVLELGSSLFDNAVKMVFAESQARALHTQR